MHNTTTFRNYSAHSRLFWSGMIVAALVVPLFLVVPKSIAASSFRMPLGPIDTSKFVRFEAKTVPGLDIDETVDLHPYQSSSVTKIEFGRMKTVRIITTTTGVYSSDALASPYVNYPGIERIAIPVQVNSNGSITYLKTPADGLINRLVRSSSKAKSITNATGTPFNSEAFTVFNK